MPNPGYLPEIFGSLPGIIYLSISHPLTRDIYQINLVLSLALSISSLSPSHQRYSPEIFGSLPGIIYIYLTLSLEIFTGDIWFSPWHYLSLYLSLEIFTRGIWFSPWHYLSLTLSLEIFTRDIWFSPWYYLSLTLSLEIFTRDNLFSIYTILYLSISSLFFSALETYLLQKPFLYFFLYTIICLYISTL